MLLTEKLQIDALLTGSISKLVSAFCNDSWDSLPRLWTVSASHVLAEAERRGWECFVSCGSISRSEDYHVLETSGGFASCYVERGEPQKSSIRHFRDLEEAVRDMLQRRMQEAGLLPQT